MSGFNRSFVGVSRRPCCRSQQRLIFILLVERFDRYCAPNLDRCLLLRRDRDCFADLGRSLCSLSGGLASIRRVTCRVYLTLASRTIHVLISRSEEHTSELQSRENLVCRLLLEKK